MTLDEFIELYCEMRAAQDTYYKTPHSQPQAKDDRLRVAKAKERSLDKIAADLRDKSPRLFS